MSLNFWIALGSVGTFLIVVINLVIILVIPRWKRPKIQIEFHDEEPFCRTTTSKSIQGKDSVLSTNWIRLQVSNSGRSLARHCVCKLVKLMDKDGKERSDFDPMQLHWVSTNWGDSPFRAIDFGRDDYEYLDLLVAQAGQNNIYIAGDQFPQTNYQRRGILSSLPPDKYILSVTGYGDNIEPETRYVSLIWGGGDIADISIELHNSLKDAKSRLQ